MDSSSLTLVTGPTSEPLHRQEIKEHLRIDGEAEDVLLDSLVRAAREYVETYTGRQLVTATWRRKYDSWPTDDILLGTPLVSVTSVTYVDGNGTTQTLASTEYDVDLDSQPGCIRLAYNKTWPSIRGQPRDIAITYVVGHACPFTAAAATDVLTISGRTFTNTDPIRLSNSGGLLPGGLTTNTTYYVRDYSAGTLKLAASSGGTAIDVTSTGTGTHFLGEIPEPIRQAMKLLCGHWYENREAVTVGVMSRSMEFAVNSLLWSQAVRRF